MKRPSWIAVLASLAIVLSFQNCAKGLPNIQADEAALASETGGCIFDGEAIGNGQQLTTYSSSSAVSASACTVLAETRVCTNGTLSGSFTNLSCTVSSTGAGSSISLALTTNASNYNIFAAAGSPTTAVTVNLTVNSGVVVSATSSSIAAMTTGAFAAGSVVNLINNGTIEGAGGAGGVGGAYNGSPTSGTPGGAAISLTFPVSITNSGTIAGGGGGGGGGAGCSGRIAYGAGGGGGGAGSTPGLGGAGGADPEFGYPGTAGGTGSLTAGGGAGQPGYSPCTVGGAGGGLGQPGGAGATSGTTEGIVVPAATAAGGGGGAGAAVISNGQAVHWISGGSAPNVLGAID